MQPPRIKFSSEREGDLALPPSPVLEDLAVLMSELEESGVIPIMYDGLVAGNCAIDASGIEGIDLGTSASSGPAVSRMMVVSKSGKAPHRTMGLGDFVLVTSFDFATWAAKYRSKDPAARPTSDAPPHAAALMDDVAAKYGWEEAPRVIVHGHALAEGPGLEVAHQLGFAISDKSTVVSTPEDLEQLQALFAQHPYPAQRVYIRRGHGFFLLGSSVEDVRHAFRNLILPNLPAPGASS